MTKIYLIRHAEAEGNLYRRSQGQYDANITRLGQAQIEALAERFRDVSVDALWSSDLHRTQATATAILKYHPHLTLHTTPALREVCMGVWEDMPWGNIDKDYHEQMECFSNDPARWSVPGSESYETVIARIKKAILKLAEAYDGKTIAVVSHGFAIRSLLCDHFAIPSAEFSRLPYGDNTSVALLNVEGGDIAVEWYNDNAHLSDKLSTFARQRWWRQKHGDAKEYFVFEPLNPDRESELYSRCYADTWMASHGDLEGYTPSLYLHTARMHARQDPRCLMKLLQGEQAEFAGLIELDPERGAEDGAGWISLLYVEPDHRERRLGIQLVGHAVSYFRKAGRKSIRLHVSRTNERATGFYRHNGFVTIGETQGVGGKLYLMELDITQRMFTLE